MNYRLIFGARFMTSTAKLLSVSTAVPLYKFDQQKVKETVSQIYFGPRDVPEKMNPPPGHGL